MPIQSRTRFTGFGKSFLRSDDIGHFHTPHSQVHERLALQRVKCRFSFACGPAGGAIRLRIEAEKLRREPAIP
jgi:hypothetical protein